MSLGRKISANSLLRGMAWSGAFALAAYDGGAFVDLADLGGAVYGAAGLGLPGIAPVVAAGTLQGVEIGDRTVVLICSAADRVALMSSLYALLAPDRSGAAAPNTPAILRYTRGADVLDLRVVLAAAPVADRGGGVVVQLRALESFWRDGGGAVSASLAMLSTVNLSAAQFMLHRTAAGVWSASSGGPTADVTALHYGAASGALFAGTVGGDVWTWNGASWTHLGASLGGAIKALLEAPTGALYAAGLFAGGVKVYTSSWATVGAVGGSCYSLGIGPDGAVYVGSGGGVKRWDGGSWSSWGSGLGDTPAVLLLGPDNKLYAIGASVVARLDDGVWVALPEIVGFSEMYAGAFEPSGRLVVAGAVPGGAQSWNGAGWTNLGLNGEVGTIFSTARGLHLIGSFDAAGGVALWSNCAIRRGGTYYSFELQADGGHGLGAAVALPGGGMAVAISGGVSGVVYAAAHTAIVPDGSAVAWPVITCEYNGSAVGAVLYYVVNLTTGDELHFDGLRVLPGEVVTIDCERVTVTSSYRGDLSATVRAGSRTLRLLPGRTNDLLCNGDVQIVATLSYTPRYAMVAA